MNKLELAVKVIDDKFGENYAQDNPELVGQVMIADALFTIIEATQDAIVSVGSLSKVISLFKGK